MEEAKMEVSLIGKLVEVLGKRSFCEVCEEWKKTENNEGNSGSSFEKSLNESQKVVKFTLKR